MQPRQRGAQNSHGRLSSDPETSLVSDCSAGRLTPFPPRHAAVRIREKLNKLGLIQAVRKKGRISAVTTAMVLVVAIISNNKANAKEPRTLRCHLCENQENPPKPHILVAHVSACMHVCAREAHRLADSRYQGGHRSDPWQVRGGTWHSLSPCTPDGSFSQQEGTRTLPRQSTGCINSVC